MTYSIDFRRKVLEIKEKEGLSVAEAAQRFGIGTATITRWHNRLEPMRTRIKPTISVDMIKLARDVREHPDSYQRERAARLGVSKNGICQALKRMNITRKKKTLRHPRADEQKREEFHRKRTEYEQQNRTIVYIDESGFASDMPRTHGWSEKGARCFGTHNWQERGRINVIGALIKDKFLTVTLFDCSIDSTVFSEWVYQDLLPKLPPHAVIVMDNATFHKNAVMQQKIVAEGHELLYLPPYSPDLNPIENKWSSTKHARRTTQVSVAQLFEDPTLYVSL